MHIIDKGCHELYFIKFNSWLISENEKEKWRILTNKEIYAMVKNTTIETLVWACTHNRRKQNLQKKKCYINL
jgi:hypothetical protein